MCLKQQIINVNAILTFEMLCRKTCESAPYRLILALDFFNWLLKMMESETVEPKTRLTLGEFLKQVRETHGLSLEYVAEQLKLKVSTVRDLEANRYDNVGRLVYIKGYLRSYARLLNLDIEDQLQLNNNSDTEAAHVPKNDECTHKQKKAIPGKLFLLLCLAVILILLALFGVHFYKTKNKSRSINKPAAIPVVVDSKPLAPLPSALSHPNLNIAQAAEKQPTAANASDEPPANSESAVE